MDLSLLCSLSEKNVAPSEFTRSTMDLLKKSYLFVVEHRGDERIKIAVINHTDNVAAQHTSYGKGSEGNSVSENSNFIVVDCSFLIAARLRTRVITSLLLPPFLHVALSRKEMGSSDGPDTSCEIQVTNTRDTREFSHSPLFRLHNLSQSEYRRSHKPSRASDISGFPIGSSRRTKFAESMWDRDFSTWVSISAAKERLALRLA